MTRDMNGILDHVKPVSKPNPIKKHGKKIERTSAHTLSPM